MLEQRFTAASSQWGVEEERPEDQMSSDGEEELQPLLGEATRIYRAKAHAINSIYRFIASAKTAIDNSPEGKKAFSEIQENLDSLQNSLRLSDINSLLLFNIYIDNINRGLTTLNNLLDEEECSRQCDNAKTALDKLSLILNDPHYFSVDASSMPSFWRGESSSSLRIPPTSSRASLLTSHSSEMSSSLDESISTDVDEHDEVMVIEGNDEYEEEAEPWCGVEVCLGYTRWDIFRLLTISLATASLFGFGWILGAGCNWLCTDEPALAYFGISNCDSIWFSLTESVSGPPDWAGPGAVLNLHPWWNIGCSVGWGLAGLLGSCCLFLYEPECRQLEQQFRLGR